MRRILDAPATKRYVELSDMGGEEESESSTDRSCCYSMHGKDVVRLHAPLAGKEGSVHCREGERDELVSTNTKVRCDGERDFLQMRYVQRGEEDSATRPVTLWVRRKMNFE